MSEFEVKNHDKLINSVRIELTHLDDLKGILAQDFKDVQKALEKATIETEAELKDNSIKKAELKSDRL